MVSKSCFKGDTVCFGIISLLVYNNGYEDDDDDNGG